MEPSSSLMQGKYAVQLRTSFPLFSLHRFHRILLRFSSLSPLLPYPLFTPSFPSLRQETRLLMRKIFERLVTMRGSPRQREISLFNSLCLSLRETHEHIEYDEERGEALSLSLSLRVLEKNTDKVSVQPRELVSFLRFFLFFFFFTFLRPIRHNKLCRSAHVLAFRERNVSFNHCHLLLYLSRPLFMRQWSLHARGFLSEFISNCMRYGLLVNFSCAQINICGGEIWFWWFIRLESYLVSCREESKWGYRSIYRFEYVNTLYMLYYCMY